ncbi:hypothetical protein KCU78_g484, partial [Aureobasidium melanogenum]
MSSPTRTSGGPIRQRPFRQQVRDPYIDEEKLSALLRKLFGRFWEPDIKMVKGVYTFFVLRELTQDELGFRAWLEYMQFYDMKISKHFNDLVIVSEELLPDHVNFEQIADLRYVEEKLLPLRPVYDHLARVFKSLRELKTSQDVASPDVTSQNTHFEIALRNYEHQLSGFTDDAALLRAKVTSVSQLLSDTLMFKQQNLVAAQNQLVLKLTQSSVKDSAAVRVITILTLLYLPATTIATILDMPFFTGESSWKVSPKIWIFFAISVPLTLFTLLLAALWIWKTSNGQESSAMDLSDAELGDCAKGSSDDIELRDTRLG